MIPSVRVEDAVTSCLEGDGELLALQRLPEFKVDGHSAIYDYVRSLLSPGTAPAILFPWPNAFLVMGDSQTPQLDQTQLFMHALAAVTAAPLASIDFSTIDLSSKPHVLSAAPTLSEFLSLCKSALQRRATKLNRAPKLRCLTVSCSDNWRNFMHSHYFPRTKAEFVRWLLHTLSLFANASHFPLLLCISVHRILTSVAKEAGSSGTRPLVDYLFRDEGSSQTSVISSGIDDAVAAKGHTPSAGSTFYVRLWSHPAKGLSILEGILANSETSQEGSSGQSDTSERSEGNQI